MTRCLLGFGRAPQRRAVQLLEFDVFKFSPPTPTISLAGDRRSREGMEAAARVIGAQAAHDLRLPEPADDPSGCGGRRCLT